MAKSDSDKSVSFMRSLCMGQIEEDVLLPFPTMSDDEKEMLRGVSDALSTMLGAHAHDFRKWDREGHFPESFIDELKEFGAFGLVIPEEHGGLGFGSMAYSRALQEVAKYDASTAVTIGAHSSIGMRGLLLFGTDEQKAKFMPKLSTGEMIAAFCLTEPGAGSDAASIKTTAVKDGDEWVLNGNKLWITNGGIAQFFTVFAKTGGQAERGNMTAFIVTRDMPGVSIGPHEDKMGIRASSTTTVHFDNVRVPCANVLGEVGKGFKVAMKILNSGRTGLGGGAVGAMKKMISLATVQAKERVQFGKPIAEYGLVKQKIGQMVVDCYVTESAVNMVTASSTRASRTTRSRPPSPRCSPPRRSGAPWTKALQIAGGNGFMREFPYERMLRDCRINRIFEGTNDILRLFIALTAMNEVGSELKELAELAQGHLRQPHQGLRRALGVRAPPRLARHHVGQTREDEVHEAARRAREEPARLRRADPRARRRRRSHPAQARQGDHRQAVRLEPPRRDHDRPLRVGLRHVARELGHRGRRG